MAASYPGGAGPNTFIPTFDEMSGKLVVNYSRNPKEFALLRYCQLVPVKRTLGYYLRITPENAARILTTNISDQTWAPGANRPTGRWNDESFEFFPFACKRYSANATLDALAVDLADWNVLSYWSGMLAQQLMTGRVLQAITLLQTAGTWPTGNTDSATNIGGGFFSAGTATNPIILKAFNAMARQIQIATLGAVKPKDLHVVIDPIAADGMARSQEIHSYLQQQVGSLDVIKGEGDFNPNAAWGLPKRLYGFDLEIDDTVRVTSAKGATLAEGYVKSSNSLFMLAKPGGLTGIEGSASWSTIQLFSHEEMKVESESDNWNRLQKLSVTDYRDFKVVSPISGYLLTNLFS